MMELAMWVIAILCTLLLVFTQGIYWFSAQEAKLWMDRHLMREGRPVPERRGFWWSFFLWLHRKLV